MKVKELRIGNLLMDNLTGAILRVDELTLDGKIVTYVIDRSLFPLPKGWKAEVIPLTDELLINFGFERSGMYFVKDQVYVYLAAHIAHDYEYRFNYTYTPIRYVHQLQNLYFFLTNKELCHD